MIRLYKLNKHDIEELNEETTTINESIVTINESIESLEDNKQNNITTSDTIQISKLKHNI